MHCLYCKQPLLKKQAHYGLHPACFQALFQVEDLPEFENLLRQASDSESLIANGNEYWNSSFFQGRFRKYSASLGGHDYLLKVEQELAPELPQVEYVCNQIAEAVGLDVPRYMLISFEGLPCFVTRNFISDLKGSGTLDHIYHYVASGKEFCCKQLIKIIAEQTQHLQNIEAFINMCLFDALIANHDRHGRNIGFIVTAKEKRLAPCYDNVSALGLESGAMLRAAFEPRGKIFTEQSSEPVMRDYAVEFIRLGYESIVTEFFKAINLEQILQLINTSNCSALMQAALITIVKRRYRELQDALSTLD